MVNSTSRKISKKSSISRKQTSKPEIESLHPRESFFIRSQKRYWKWRWNSYLISLLCGGLIILIVALIIYL